MSEGDQPPTAGSANAGWQPIETAPKHSKGKPINSAGPWVLLYGPDVLGSPPRSYVARWVGFAWDVSPVAGGPSHQGYIYSPSHWMPLPAKPEPRVADKP
jgi:hypothetical protein